MIDTHMNIFDAVVIGVMLLSCIFAFFRGFVREILSLGAWIGAAIVTMYFFPHVTEMIKPHFKSATGAAGLATLGIYISALIIFSIINMLILKFVKKGSEVGMLDNFLGLIFGIVRGVLLLSLGYFMLTMALPEKEYPDWLKRSFTRPYVEMGAVRLAKIAPGYLREISTLQKRVTVEVESARDKNTDTEREEETTVTTPTDEETGYSPKDSDQVNRLIDATPTHP